MAELGLQQTAQPGKAIEDMNSFEQGIENWWTGSLDYARELEKLGIQNQFSAQEAQKNRDWQERLSNTAYSRAVADMKNAGLNPYLMYGSASAASTPAGAVASVGAGGVNARSKGVSSLINAVLGLVGSAVKLGTMSKADVPERGTIGF